MLFALIHGLLRLEPATSHGVPRRERHAKVAGHGQDVALKVPEHEVPAALVDAELDLAMGARVVVGRADNPGGQSEMPR